MLDIPSNNLYNIKVLPFVLPTTKKKNGRTIHVEPFLDSGGDIFYTCNVHCSSH